MGMSRVGYTGWAFDTVCRGVVRQVDIPEILTEISHEMTMTELAAQLGVSKNNMTGYRTGDKPMGRFTGQKLVEWLERRYAAKKEAVSAGTDTTGKEERTVIEPSTVIVPQVDKKELDAAQARIAELDEALETALAESSNRQTRVEQLEQELAELRRVQGQQIADDDTIAVLEGMVDCRDRTIRDLRDEVTKLHEEHLRDLETIRDLAVRALGLEARG